MAKGMPWIPANMTPERLEKVEQFSRFRRISRHEAAALLIDAGIEALRPVVAEELAAQHARIRAGLLGPVDPGIARKRRTMGMGHNSMDTLCIKHDPTGEGGSVLSICMRCKIERGDA